MTDDTLAGQALVEDVALEIGLHTGARHKDVHAAARAALAAVARRAGLDAATADAIASGLEYPPDPQDPGTRVVALLRALAEVARDD